MLKINVVMADSDEWYIDGLSSFTRNKYFNKFNVNVFTKEKSLCDFLEANSGKVDILLANPELLTDEIMRKDARLKIVLGNGRGADNHNGLPCINKYQPGDVILGRIIELLADISSGVGLVLKGGKRTSLVSVFSPQGGCGKTTVAVALAHQFSVLGLKTFYLNLQTINITGSLFEQQGTAGGMSNLFYYLRENKENISVRIDSIKCCDKRLGISYFAAPDCSMELDELSEQDIRSLLHELKELGQFDVIVADMDTSLNKRNLTVINSSHMMLLVLKQEELAKQKLDSLKKDLVKVLGEDGSELFDKSVKVINRDNALRGTEFAPGSTAIDAFIPDLQDIYVSNGVNTVFNTASAINAHVNPIARKVAKVLDIGTPER